MLGFASGMRESPPSLVILWAATTLYWRRVQGPDDPRSCVAGVSLIWLNVLSHPGRNQVLCLGRSRVVTLFLYQNKQTNKQINNQLLRTGASDFWVWWPFLTLWSFISTVNRSLVQVCHQPRWITDDFKKYSYDSFLHNLFKVSRALPVSTFSAATSDVPPRGTSSFS